MLTMEEQAVCNEKVAIQMNPHRTEFCISSMKHINTPFFILNLSTKVGLIQRLEADGTSKTCSFQSRLIGGSKAH